MTDLDLSYLKASTLLLPFIKHIELYLIGCGGTGSWLAPALVRTAKILLDRQVADVQVIFVDPDIVEPKNVFRQNFCAAEVGKNKAATLAFRLGIAHGLKINAAPEPISRTLINHNSSSLTLLVGCVDNPAARQVLAEITTMTGGYYRGGSYSVWWLDCGNWRTSGQVLLGRGIDPEHGFCPEGALTSVLGKCIWLPAPDVQHPELVAHEPMPPLPYLEADLADANLSCADLALRDEQGRTINQAVAAVAADYLDRLLITHTLRRFATYIDLEGGIMSSRPITPEAIQAVMERTGKKRKKQIR